MPKFAAVIMPDSASIMDLQIQHNSFPGNVTIESDAPGTYRFHFPANYQRMIALVNGEDRRFHYYAKHEDDSNTVTLVAFNIAAGEPTDGGLLHVQLYVEAYA